jgi:putative aldouronate transport system substrate-binding protein
MSYRPIGRRSFLVGAGGGAAALLGIGSVSGCNSGGGGSQANSAESNSKVALPTYVPYTGITPDLAASTNGVDPAFRHFPKEHPKSVTDKPGNGETVSGMSNIFNAVPPGLGSNSYWAGLNDRLGVDLKFQMVPAADYEQKFATTIAGNDLPDLVQMRPVANLPALLDKRFTRLDLRRSDPARCGSAVQLHPSGSVRSGRDVAGAEELRGTDRDRQGADQPEGATLGLRLLGPCA